VDAARRARACAAAAGALAEEVPLHLALPPLALCFEHDDGRPSLPRRGAPMSFNGGGVA